MYFASIVAIVIIYSGIVWINYRVQKLLNNGKYREGVIEDFIITNIRQWSFDGLLSRLLKISGYLTKVDKPPSRISTFTFMLTDLGLKAKEMRNFNVALFVRIPWFSLLNLLKPLIAIGSLLWILNEYDSIECGFSQIISGNISIESVFECFRECECDFQLPNRMQSSIPKTNWIV